MKSRVYNALILCDYIEAPYARWMKEGKKTIETRMKKFSYRGDLIICCSNKSLSENSGRALCIVNLFDARLMTLEDEPAACCSVTPGRIAHFTKDLRHFSYDFLFSKCRVSGAYQSIFQIQLPEKIQIIAA